MKVLIVDDEPNIRKLLSRYLDMEGYESVSAKDGKEALSLLDNDYFDAMLLDLKMPGMDGLEVLRQVRSKGLQIPIIIISAHGDINDAVEALKSGAQDYVVKPFEPPVLIVRLNNAINASNLKSSKNSNKSIDLIGESIGIKKIREIVKIISDSTSTVLITGESGSGKEVVARLIHESSSVSNHPFVAINIGGILDTLLESELFGYEKGAFTGANSRKIGLFELANGGTLFLDEIGDMPINLQVKLLRVLQEKKITRLGSVEPIPIKARIIAATNKNLEQLVSTGEFREDLYYRLNVVRVNVPPLRERKEDIGLISKYILNKLKCEMGSKIVGITDDAIKRLENHDFYGNVRELENILERASIFAEGNNIGANDLDLDNLFVVNPIKEKALSLKENELILIKESLERNDHNRTKTAAELGISRRSLIYKIAEYNLDNRK